MGVLRVTSRPAHYRAYEEQEMKRIRTEGIRRKEDDDAREREEAAAWIMENIGRLSFRLEVGGIREMMMRHKQKRLLEVMNRAIGVKGSYVRQYSGCGDYGYYLWDRFMLYGNVITTDPFLLDDIGPVLKVVRALDEAGWFPDNDIKIQFTAEKGDKAALANLITILGSRQPLIEQALSLKKPLQIILDRGVALGIALSAFSYLAVEAAAFLLEQAWKMALSTGRARMKPCDMSNPKYQMRSWLLRLGFIGDCYERPRRTLLEGLSGDIAFYSEEQKRRAEAKRKARKMNEIPI